MNYQTVMRHKNLIAIVGLGLFAVLCVWLAVLPALDRWRTIAQQQQLREQLLAREAEVTNEIAQMEKELGLLRKKSNALTIPGNARTDELISRLPEAATAAGMKLLSLIPGSESQVIFPDESDTPPVSFAALSRQPVRVELLGDWRALPALLNSFRAMGGAVKLETFTILPAGQPVVQPAGQPTGQPDPPAPSRIEMTLVFHSAPRHR